MCVSALNCLVLANTLQHSGLQSARFPNPWEAKRLWFVYFDSLGLNIIVYNIEYMHVC